MSHAQLPVELLAECHDLALTVAPELAAAPLYVTDLPAEYPHAADTLAFTITKGFDFSLRQHLIDQGLWRGPGALVAFCEPMNRDDALGLLLHEVSHNPFTTHPADVEPTPGLLAVQRQFIANRLAQPVGDLPTMPAWYKSHGLRFVRRCVHAHARAWRAGYEIGLPAIAFAGPHYDLSPPWKYRRALGDEPQRMATATFREIDAAPMPQPFRALFHSDYQDWCDRTGKESSHVHAA